MTHLSNETLTKALDELVRRVADISPALQTVYTTDQDLSPEDFQQFCDNVVMMQADILLLAAEHRGFVRDQKKTRRFNPFKK